MSTPVRFIFGLHVHQPVGNFGKVFEDHVRDVYDPLISQLERRRLRPSLLHISGPLLEWLEANDTRLLDRIGRLVADGALELLLAGMYEPILAAIPRADRVEQIAWHRDALRARFGTVGKGLWLTERVWEPDLAYDLATAGVEYVFVDDRHFLVSGLRRDELHVPLRTESDGRAVSVLAIDERLRYLIPFKPPEDFAAYCRHAQASGYGMVVFADDGEKFGGWPGTKDWVYTRGWFDSFCDMLDVLQDGGTIRMSTGADAIATIPARGPVYLPTASYQEMEGWSLPADASRRLAKLEHDLGAERMAGPDRAFVRGAHWRNFLAKYAESNRMHKKMVALSALRRVRENGIDAERAVARAQCNDAYWHGVFGGLYLPHLRHSVWRELADAERILRRGETIATESGDFDFDGSDEIWIHSDAFSALVAPARGGALVELTYFDRLFNFAATLTRRQEAYHLPPLFAPDAHGHGSGAASIHDMEASLGMSSAPPVDRSDRAIGVPRVISSSVTHASYAAAAYAPVADWSDARCTVTTTVADGSAIVRCEHATLTVEWRFDARGAVDLMYAWDARAYVEGDRFAPEISLAGPLTVTAPDAIEIWRYEIETTAKSERGIDVVVQGTSITPLFDARAGVARVRIG